MATRSRQTRRAFLQDLSLAGAASALFEQLPFSWASDNKEKDSRPELGINASLNGKRVFPADNP